MNVETLEPRNDVERQLAAAHEGRLPMDQLLPGLLTAQLFMPVKDTAGTQGFQASPQAEPLALQAEDGTRVLILFTSPERAKAFLQDFPGYPGGILESLRWILQKMGSGFGIAINPDWALGVDLDPKTVEQLARIAAAPS